MSWNVSLIGHPEDVAKALERESEKFNGQSKIEYESAKPFLIGMVLENFTKESAVSRGYLVPIVHLTASGSGGSVGDEQTNRTLSVRLDPLYAKLV